MRYLAIVLLCVAPALAADVSLIWEQPETYENGEPVPPEVMDALIWEIGWQPGLCESNPVGTFNPPASQRTTSDDMEASIGVTCSPWCMRVRAVPPAGEPSSWSPTFGEGYPVDTGTGEWCYLTLRLSPPEVERGDV